MSSTSAAASRNPWEDIQLSKQPTISPDSDYSEVTVEVLSPSMSRHDMRFAGGSDSGLSDDRLSISEEPEEEPYRTKPISRLQRSVRKVTRYLRQAILFICWLTFTYFLMFYQEHEYEPTLISVSSGQQGISYRMDNGLQGISLVMKLIGPFTQNTFKANDLEKKNQAGLLAFVMQEVTKDNEQVKNISNVNYLPMDLTHKQNEQTLAMVMVEKLLGNLTFDLTSHKYQLLFFTNIEETLSMELFVVSPEVSKMTGIILTVLLLSIVYVNLMFDMVHRTFAVVISCSLCIGILAAVHLRPTLNEVFQYIEFEIIMTFFGISIIVEILAETGLQDYLAAVSYEMSNGHIWPLLNFLFLISCTLSTIFNDITLILFLAPIGLRLCEIMHLNCTPILSCLIIAINVGSSLTPASSVSNNLLSNHPLIPKDEVTFGSFTLHMLPATLLALMQSYIHLRLQFINSDQIGAKEPLQLERLKRLTRVWRKVSDRMGGYSLDERSAKATVDTRIRSLRKRVKRLGKMPDPPKGFEEKVQKLRKNFPLKKLPLMVACLAALSTVLLLSLLNLCTNFINVSTGWSAILGALLALSMCNFEDIEGILSRIDWSTLLSSASLFTLMNALMKLGLTETLGLLLEQFIENVEQKHRLTVAILATVWLSAGLSTIMGNAPVVTMMTQIIVTLSRSEELYLPLIPLVWSLTLGCCFGGNGSLLGAVVNIACAGVASKHGYALSYFGYLKIGFLVMIGNVALASCYLLLAHVVGHWH